MDTQEILSAMECENETKLHKRHAMPTSDEIPEEGCNQGVRG